MLGVWGTHLHSLLGATSALFSPTPSSSPGAWLLLLAVLLLLLLLLLLLGLGLFVSLLPLLMLRRPPATPELKPPHHGPHLAFIILHDPSPKFAAATPSASPRCM